MDYTQAGYNMFLEQPLPSSSGQSELDFESLLNDTSISLPLVGSNAIGTNQLKDGAVTSAKVSELSADKILAGIIEAEVEVGVSSKRNAYVKLDGPNNRIVVHDGNTPRIVIGNVK